MLCSWARHFTLSVPLSTQVNKWVLPTREEQQTSGSLKQQKTKVKCRAKSKLHCCTSQLLYVFRLEENVSHVMGQNLLILWGEKNSLTFTSDVIRSYTFKTLQICVSDNVKQNIFFFCSLFHFWVGRHNKTLNDYSHGKQQVLFSLDPHWGRSLSVYEWTNLRLMCVYLSLKSCRSIVQLLYCLQASFADPEHALPSSAQTR